MEWVPIFNFRLFVKLGGSIFQKTCFLEMKEYALNTSLKKRICSIEIVKIDAWIVISYCFIDCCHIIYLCYRILDHFLNLLHVRYWKPGLPKVSDYFSFQGILT